jgi:hypothetical protein
MWDGDIESDERHPHAAGFGLVMRSSGLWGDACGQPEGIWFMTVSTNNNFSTSSEYASHFHTSQTTAADYQSISYSTKLFRSIDISSFYCRRLDSSIFCWKSYQFSQWCPVMTCRYFVNMRMLLYCPFQRALYKCRVLTILPLLLGSSHAKRAGENYVNEKRKRR